MDGNINVLPKTSKKEHPEESEENKPTCLGEKINNLQIIYKQIASIGENLKKRFSQLFPYIKIEIEIPRFKEINDKEPKIKGKCIYRSSLPGESSLPDGTLESVCVEDPNKEGKTAIIKIREAYTHPLIVNTITKAILEEGFQKLSTKGNPWGEIGEYVFENINKEEKPDIKTQSNKPTSNESLQEKTYKLIKKFLEEKAPILVQEFVEKGKIHYVYFPPDGSNVMLDRTLKLKPSELAEFKEDFKYYYPFWRALKEELEQILGKPVRKIEVSIEKTTDEYKIKILQVDVESPILKSYLPTIIKDKKSIEKMYEEISVSVKSKQHLKRIILAEAITSSEYENIPLIVYYGKRLIDFESLKNPEITKNLSVGGYFLVLHKENVSEKDIRNNLVWLKGAAGIISTTSQPLYLLPKIDPYHFHKDERHPSPLTYGPVYAVEIKSDDYNLITNVLKDIYAKLIDNVDLEKVLKNMHEKYFTDPILHFTYRKLTSYLVIHHMRASPKEKYTIIIKPINID